MLRRDKLLHAPTLNKISLISLISHGATTRRKSYAYSTTCDRSGASTDRPTCSVARPAPAFLRRCILDFDISIVPVVPSDIAPVLGRVDGKNRIARYVRSHEEIKWNRITWRSTLSARKIFISNFHIFYNFFQNFYVFLYPFYFSSNFIFLSFFYISLISDVANSKF